MSARLLLAAALLGALPGCVAPPPAGNPVCAETPSEVWLVRELAFVRMEGRAADGFDLDGVVDGTCDRRDAVAPDGRMGIDNELAGLIPLVEAQVNQPIDGLVQNAINNGQILLAFELEGLDDFHADGCVGIRMRRLTGMPLLAANGFILAGQTLYSDPTAPESYTGDATIVDGVLEAGPVDLALPVAILNANFVLDIDDALLSAELDEEAGTLTMMIGGGVTTDQLVSELAATEGVPTDILDLAEGLLRGRADLAPDASGECQQFSAVMRLVAVRGFIGEE